MIDQTGSVRAPTITSVTDDNNIGNGEIQKGTGTYKRYTSAKGSCHNTGRGDLD